MRQEIPLAKHGACVLVLFGRLTSLATDLCRATKKRKRRGLNLVGREEGLEEAAIYLARRVPGAAVERRTCAREEQRRLLTLIFSFARPALGHKL